MLESKKEYLKNLKNILSKMQEGAKNVVHYSCNLSQRLGELYNQIIAIFSKESLIKKLRNPDNRSNFMALGVSACNILKSFDMMWLFLKEPEIELTNNFAERQVKHHVKYRKNSFFTWSDRGDRFLERIKSIYASCKLQSINPFQHIISQLA